LDGVVAAALPWVDERRLAVSARVSLLQQEAMPAHQGQEESAGLALVGMLFEQNPRAACGERRLGDRGDPPPVGPRPLAPPAWPGHVARSRPGHTGERAP